MAAAFSQSRFVAVVGDVLLRCTRIKNVALGLLLERSHAEKQPLLSTAFRGHQVLDVWLVNLPTSQARHFQFSFDAVLPLPLDLNSEVDMTGDMPAPDRVLLRNALLVSTEDVPLEQCPDVVKTLRRRNTRPYTAR